MTEEKIWRMCGECGDKKYGKKELGTITISKGTCPVCGKEDQTLIPVVDFEGLGDYDD